MSRRVDGVELDAIDATLCDASALDAVDAGLSPSPMKHGRRARARQADHASILT